MKNKFHYIIIVALLINLSSNTISKKVDFKLTKIVMYQAYGSRKTPPSYYLKQIDVKECKEMACNSSDTIFHFYCRPIFDKKHEDTVGVFCHRLPGVYMIDEESILEITNMLFHKDKIFRYHLYNEKLINKFEPICSLYRSEHFAIVYELFYTNGSGQEKVICIPYNESKKYVEINKCHHKKDKYLFCIFLDKLFEHNNCVKPIKCDTQ